MQNIDPKTDFPVVFPGSFDPIHNGHLDLIERAAASFGGVLVVILTNVSKSSWFTIAQRVAMVQEATRHLPNVSVGQSGGLLIDFVRSSGARLIVRGLRSSADFEYERPMAIANRWMASGVETIFMAATPSLLHLSASLVKELAGLGVDVAEMVPPVVVQYIQRRLAQPPGPSPGH